VTDFTRREVLKVGAGGAAVAGASALGFDVAVAKATTVKQGLRIAGATVSRSVCP
jgi:anaerobic selenocysteine-containing dehydrogenase